MERTVFPDTLKADLISGKPLVGTFVKNVAHEQIEVLGMSGLDLAVLDAEHAPFDRRSLDACILAAKVAQLPLLVRVACLDPAAILQALDMGACGVLVPHVRTAADAGKLARISHFGAGGRGFAGTTRAADYGQKPIAQHLADTARNTVVIGQIEDVEALDELESLFATDGIDGYLIGRVDLTVALGETSVNSPRVDAAVETICRAARNSNKVLGMFLSDLSEIPRWQALGMSFFLAGSDHSFVFNGARALQRQFDALANQ